MTERMDFADGKYTVINENGKLTALRHGEPWGRDLTGDNLIYWMLMDAMKLLEERDALAAKLAELERQDEDHRILKVLWEAKDKPTEFVNARLLEALKRLSFCAQTTGGVAGRDDELCSAIEASAKAIAEAEAALAEPQPDADGWIPWAGGECPVGAKTGVQVKDRTGRTCLGAGWEFDWEHAASDYDILAYRIVRK